MAKKEKAKNGKLDKTNGSVKKAKVVKKASVNAVKKEATKKAVVQSAKKVAKKTAVGTVGAVVGAVIGNAVGKKKNLKSIQDEEEKRLRQGY